MPEPVSLDDFAPLLNQTFIMRDDDRNQVEVTLVQAQALPAHPRPANHAPQRQPFALLFRGPFQPILPQRIYALGHESFGETSLFVVPIGPDAAGQRYEVVFN